MCSLFWACSPCVSGIYSNIDPPFLSRWQKQPWWKPILQESPVQCDENTPAYQTFTIVYLGCVWHIKVCKAKGKAICQTQGWNCSVFSSHCVTFPRLVVRSAAAYLEKSVKRRYAAVDWWSWCMPQFQINLTPVAHSLPLERMHVLMFYSAPLFFDNQPIYFQTVIV